MADGGGGGVRAMAAESPSAATRPLARPAALSTMEEDGGQEVSLSAPSPVDLALRTAPCHAPSVWKSIPGGGRFLPKGDQPGQPFATLVVVVADGLVEHAPPRWARGGAADALPPQLAKGVDAAVKLTGEVQRSVVICAAGANATAAQMMTQVVARMPGGIDAFGPGRRVEALLKESSAEFGNLWETALHAKALAKRQRSLTRFGEVVVITSPQMAEVTVRRLW
mmetsp:Transcript_7516/g.23336  ORF Transcript_7516/g.23336 Transcript_7516/m.23336 type:complete len:224 (-) Transcript_7516:1019-1690(-)